MIELAVVLTGIAATIYCCYFHGKNNKPQEMKWL